MSEGDTWIHKSAHDVGLLLRDTGTRPVAEAETMVRRFATRELRSVPHGVAEVEEYVANATLDLVIMAAWGVASSQLGVDPLPVSLCLCAADFRRIPLLVTCARLENYNKL